MKRLLDHDELTGVATWFVGDDDPETFHTIITQDVEPFIERNKALQNTGREYWKAGGDFRHEATIPVGVQMKWLTEKGVDVYNPDHQKAVIKLLNDPEWRYLKTAEIII